MNSAGIKLEMRACAHRTLCRIGFRHIPFFYTHANFYFLSIYFFLFFQQVKHFNSRNNYMVGISMKETFRIFSGPTNCNKNKKLVLIILRIGGSILNLLKWARDEENCGYSSVLWTRREWVSAYIWFLLEDNRDDTV